jgi:hypothetical protein
MTYPSVASGTGETELRKKLALIFRSSADPAYNKGSS